MPLKTLSNKSKAFGKRANLSNELKNQFKSNKFSDKRIGENDPKMALEEKIFKRFTVARQKSKDRYNLNDENADEDVEELTHFGQSLAQIEKTTKNDVNSDDDDDDELDPEKGRINAEIVAKNFFGGFEKSNDEQNKKKNKNEWIEEMIAKSKQLKYQKQVEKDKTFDLTKKLDDDWKEMQQVMEKLLKKNSNDLERPKIDKEAKKDEDYDKLVQTLKFDLKAQPTDKLKSPEEIEKERLESFKEAEIELLKRMELSCQTKNPGLNDSKKTKIIEMNHRSVDDMDFDDFEYESSRQKQRNLKAIQEEKEEMEKAERKRKVPEEEEEDDDDDEEREEYIKSDKTEVDNEEWLKFFNKICNNLTNGKIKNEDFDKGIKEIKKKLNPGLNENNKHRLYVLTQHLIEFYRTNCLNQTLINHVRLDVISKLIFDLCTVYLKEKAGDLFHLIINEFKIESNKKQAMPNLDIIFTFKLISLIFPTSDYQHKIVTPTILLMNRYLYCSNLKTITDLFKGLFLANICYEYIVRSKRYMPECINFLNSCLYLAIEKDKRKTSINPFNSCIILKSFKLASKFDLIPSKKQDEITQIDLSIVNSGEENVKNDELKIWIINLCINLIGNFTKLYESNLCFKEIFEVTSILLDLVSFDLYPVDLETKIKELVNEINGKSNKPKASLELLDKKPLRLKLLEPRVEAKSKFDPRHHNSVISEKQLLTKKYKKEYKTAVKEIRLDNKFISTIQLKESMEKDKKRTKKVKEIMSSLSNQEGEFNKMKRMKN